MFTPKRPYMSSHPLTSPELLKSIINCSSTSGNAAFLRSVNKQFASTYHPRNTCFNSIFSSLSCLQWALDSGFHVNTYRMGWQREFDLHSALARADLDVIELALRSGYPLANPDLLTAVASVGRPIVLLQRLVDLGAACDADDVFQEMVQKEYVDGLIWVCGRMTPEERAGAGKLRQLVRKGSVPLLLAAMDMLIMDNSDSALIECLEHEHTAALRITEIMYPFASVVFDRDAAFMRCTNTGNTAAMSFYAERAVSEPALVVAQFSAEIDQQEEVLLWFEMHM